MGCNTQISNNVANIKNCAENGCKECQNQLGFYYQENGDLDRSIEWFRKAAAQNLLIAKHNLACKLYEKGLIEEAEKWFREAARQRYPSSLYYLGVIFERRNDICAISCYKAAAQLGNEDAIETLHYLGLYDMVMYTQPILIDFLD